MIQHSSRKLVRFSPQMLVSAKICHLRDKNTSSSWGLIRAHGQVSPNRENSGALLSALAMRLSPNYHPALVAERALIKNSAADLDEFAD